MDGSRAWYPTIISNETGSFESGQRIHVYYADKFKVPVNDSRQLTKRTFDLCLGPKCGDNSSYILSPATEGRGNTTTNIGTSILGALRYQAIGLTYPFNFFRTLSPFQSMIFLLLLGPFLSPWSGHSSSSPSLLLSLSSLNHLNFSLFCSLCTISRPLCSAFALLNCSIRCDMAGASSHGRSYSKKPTNTLHEPYDICDTSLFLACFYLCS